MTKVYAKKILNLHKDNTNYFNATLTQAEYENMLIYRIKFGQSEAFTIFAALVLAGAKFAKN